MTEPQAETGRRIDALSPEQRELLLRRLRERGAPAPATAPPAESPQLVAGPCDPHQPSPLGDTQAAFWMGGTGLYDLGGASANVYVEHEVPGSAEELAARLNLVLARAVARHPMLRTVITADGMQRVLSETPPYEVELLDLSRLSGAEIERHLESTRERLRYSRHLPGRWPLFDIAVLQLPEETIRLQARFSALLVDGTSRAQLIDELVRGVQEDEASEALPPLEVAYSDFVRALHAFRESDTWQQSRTWWLERLPTLPPAPRLPMARDFGPETVPRIVWRHVPVLEPTAWALLCRRAAQRGLTPSGIGTALVAETLRAWSEEPSFTLGLEGAWYPPVHPQIRQVIGTFTTLYLLEAEGTPGPFAQRARRLQDRLNADLDHQHFSGHEALRELNRMRRSGGRATLPIHFTSTLRSGAEPAQASEPAERPAGPPPAVGGLRQIDLMIAMPQVLLFWVLGEAGDRSLVLISQAVEELFPPGLVTDLLDGFRRLAGRLAEEDEAWSDPHPLPLPASTIGEPGRLADLGRGERLLSLADPGSALALYERQTARETGATVILPAADEHAPAAFAALAVRERATVWSSAPAVFEAALHQMENDHRLVPHTLRRVLLHRDRIPAGLPARVRALGLSVQIVHTWGTEEVPIAAAGSVEEATTGGCPPLRPAPGWLLHVLGDDHTPRPTWVPGGLYLSHGAATGPLQATGERARRLPDGSVELLGDEPPPPVEALGYGADLRRIETALQLHPAVRHAVVAWRATERRLVAWFLARSGEPPAEDALRAHLRMGGLPAHRLPSLFVRLDELPLTPEGRVDRSALALPAADPTPVATAWSPLTSDLAGLWEEILGRRPAALEDDFFDLGGDSLLAARLLGRVGGRFDLEQPLASFLDRPTFGRLAEAVEQALQEKARAAQRRRSPVHRLQTSLATLRAWLLPPATSPEYGMRSFLLLWIGQLVSALGTSLGSFSLGVWVFRKTGSTTAFALIAVIAGVISVAFAPVAGALADRWDRRRIMLFSNAGSAVMTVGLASLMFTERLELWHVYPFIAAMVSLGTLQGPALTASISSLVPRRHLARAAGLSQVSRSSVGIAGPFAAGLLVSAIGYHGVIYLDCATFLFAAVVLLLVPIPSPRAAVPSRFSILRDLGEGWAYLRERRGLFALLSMYTLTNFCMGIVQVMLAPLILSFATPVELGGVNSAAAGGALLGGLALSFWGGPRNRVRAIFIILVFQACLLLLGGVEPSIPLIAFATFGFMFTAPLISGSNQALFQSKVAPEVQGRVFGMASFLVACTMPLASAIAGPLVDRVFQPLLSPGGALAATFVGRLIGVGPGRGAGLLLVVLGIAVLVIVGLAFLNPRLRRVETEVPDASSSV